MDETLAGAKLPRPMDIAQEIRLAIDEVNELRRGRQANPDLAAAVAAIKSIQSRRFRTTYADLLGGGPFRSPVLFFLEELYGDSDYTQRDAQFSRIAGSLQRFFPEHVAVTARALACLHAATEQLDQAMGAAWMRQSSSKDAPSTVSDERRYQGAWLEVGQLQQRMYQLDATLGIGRALATLTRTTALNKLLKLMRTPAQASGLGSLQKFLESGFETFSNLARQDPGASKFLAVIEEREGRFIEAMFAESTLADSIFLGWPSAAEAACGSSTRFTNTTQVSR